MDKPVGTKVNTVAQELMKQRSFVQAVRTRGITSAARLLGLTPSAVSKNIARLEAELGAQLLARDNRSVVPTERGMQAYTAWSELLVRFDQVQQELTSADASGSTLGLSIPSGTLPWLAPLLVRYRSRFPQVLLRVNVSDSYSDLVRDRNDIALRFGQLKDANMRAASLGSTPLIVCAAPAYLARMGVPQVPADLAQHEGILFRLPESGRPRPLALTPEGTVWREVATFDDGQSLVQAALAGFGLIQVPMLLVQAELDAGVLVEVLAPHRCAELEINLLFAASAWLPAQARAFVDMAKEMVPDDAPSAAIPPLI